MNDEKSARPRLSLNPTKLIPEVGQPRGALASLVPPVSGAMGQPRGALALIPPVSGSPKLTVHSIDSEKISASVALPVKVSLPYKHFKLPRDKNRPLEFDGIELAVTTERTQSLRTAGAAMVTRAALYQTRGGKFVAEFSKKEAEPLYPNPDTPRPIEFSKVGVFETQDEAMDSFEAGGRFTLALWEQLGGQESEFIE